MLTRINADGGIVYYVSPLLRAAGVRHAFSTRLGGISPPPFDSMNLGNPSGPIVDDWARIHENYAALQRAVGLEECERCWVHQVHGDAVAIARRGAAWENGAKADAIVSDDPARIAAVRTADCTPVLLATADGRAVAAVHAGWRGVVAGVVPRAVTALVELTGGEAGMLVAAIGPAIGFEAFEVGPEVLIAFERSFGRDETVLRFRPDGKGRVHLAEAIRRQLIGAGLPTERIDTTDRCTFRDAGEFFSHRRDRGTTGRMAALIAATS